MMRKAAQEAKREAYPEAIQQEIEEGEDADREKLHYLSERAPACKAASSAMVEQVQNSGSFVTRHIASAAEVAARTGSNTIVVVAEGARVGGRQVMQVPLEVARFVARHPDAVAGAMMTFFWADTLTEWLPTVPDLRTRSNCYEPKRACQLAKPRVVGIHMVRGESVG
jgi:hypothetical protein